MERCDVILRATTVLREPDDSRIAEDAFDLFMALALAPRGALFCGTRGGRLSLETSRSLDQLALDLARREWGQAPEALAEGTPMYRQRLERSYLLLPCADGGLVSGLLYVELGLTSRRVPAAHLATFAGILGRALRTRAGLAPAPADPAPVVEAGESLAPDAERENLVLLLERNEWNVSRVARLLGVTRMTVYNRLKRYKVPRERVRKTQRRAR